MNRNLQAIQHWTYSKEFMPDGSLRDVVVLATTQGDWRSAMSFIAERGYGLSFAGRWISHTMPESIKDLFPSAPNEELAVLYIKVSDVVVVH